MPEKRRALGRGLGALIPTAAAAEGAERPVDVFFRDRTSSRAEDLVADPTDETVRSVPADSAPVEQTQDTGAPHPGAGEHATANGDTVAEDAARFPEGGNPPPAGSPAPSDGAVAPGNDQAGEQRAAAFHVKRDADAETGHLAPVPGASFAELPVGQIRPNPRQPRTVFDDDELAELVHSIREVGVLQPVVVRPVDGAHAATEGAAYELIMGERRLRASRAAGIPTIPAIVRTTEDTDLLRDALLENLHRSQLNALEEAAAYQQLLDDFQCNHDELAQRIGRSRPQISNTLRLLRLPPSVQRRVAAGVLSAGHARALLGAEDAGAMERLAQRVVAEGLSVRGTEEVVALGGATPESSGGRRTRRRDDRLDDLAAALSDRLDTRVKLALGSRRGSMTVEFAGRDDLNRILDVLGLADLTGSEPGHTDAGSDTSTTDG